MCIFYKAEWNLTYFCAVDLFLYVKKVKEIYNFKWMSSPTHCGLQTRIYWRQALSIVVWMIMLAQCSLATPYDDIEMGQHWLGWWLVVWRHQVMTWTNVDLSSVRSSDIHLRTISQQASTPSLMMTSSNGNIFCVTGPLCGEFTGHRWIPLTKASDAELWCFSLIWAWINGWVNNREAGDLRRQCAHYDVTVMSLKFARNIPI